MDSENTKTTTPPRGSASIRQLAGAVLWGIIGVRRQADHLEDLVKISLPQIVLAGFLGTATIVIVLLTVVHAALP